MRILVVDDAYDAPAIGEEWAGAVLDILQDDQLREKIDADRLSADLVDNAVEALEQGDLSNEAVEDVIDALYLAYRVDRDGFFDPDNQFSNIKGGALDALSPLMALLAGCGDEVEVVEAGRGDALEKFRNRRPDMILMDFYLSPPTSMPRVETATTNQYDRKLSIQLLKTLLSEDQGPAPAVVLMSSQDIEGKAENYRARLDGQTMALRFGYLHKSWIVRNGDALEANGEAADTLIDTSASLGFGRSLEAALSDWHEGAEKALKQLRADLRAFELRDFAYLMRFRLYDEGEPFADYLEWFLGESLRAVIDENVAWKGAHFAELDDRNLTDAIEGADLLPSQKMARFFHRMRFNRHETRGRHRFALGDVFISKNRKSVRMVISPDCDLVPRGNKIAAARILTVGGVVKGLEEDGAYAGELVWLDSSKGIKWELKDLMTHDAASIDKIKVGDSEYTFFSRLNPLPAQAIQKQALADLSRVGVAVPPTIHATAPVITYLKLQGDNQEQLVPIEGLPSSRAQVLMPRGGRDSHKRLLFSPAFVRALHNYLVELDAETMVEKYRECLPLLLGKWDNFSTQLKRTGLKLPGRDNDLLVGATAQKPSKHVWLQFVCDLSDDALIEMESVDPLKG